MNGTRSITFDRKAFAQFATWAQSDRKIHNRIITLINEISRTPFQGIGKPEPLKYGLKGYWSRRITDEHRLIYKVTDTEILILSCHSHYDE